jgi:polyisoprenoid-binding protein YceI
VLTHYGLYLMLLLVPFSGWWYNTTAGFPLKWFGLFKQPPLGEFDRALKAQARDTHEFLFWVLATTIAVHAVAALWHHYRVRDRTLVRMLPWAERRAAPCRRSKHEVLAFLCRRRGGTGRRRQRLGGALARAARIHARLFRQLPGRKLRGPFCEIHAAHRVRPEATGDVALRRGHRAGQRRHKNDERDEALRGTGFFNSKQVPQARYVATKFRALGGNRYLADGTLSLNGISKPVALEFTWTPGAQAVLAGSASLKRLDFKVGTGEWEDTDDMPNEVKVRTRLLLAPPTGTPATKKP